MKLLAAAFAVLASPALGDFSDDLKAMRQSAIERGDVVMLASFVITDYAEAAGYSEACGGDDKTASLERMSANYAKWAKPGFFDYIFGKRGKLRDRTLSSANLAYDTANYLARKKGCDRAMTLVQRKGMKTSQIAFNEYLSKPIP